MVYWGNDSWSPRKFEINLSFLKKEIIRKVFKDGINASRNAEDYKIMVVLLMRIQK